MKKISIIITKGSEAIETIIPLDVLLRAGNIVHLISLDNSDLVTTQGGSPILKANYHFDNILDWNSYDAIILPGGEGYLNFLKSNKLKKLIQTFVKGNKIVGAICASGGVLGDFGVLNKKKATAYPGFGKTLGVIWTNERVEITDNIITSKGPGTAFLFALTLVKKLNGTSLSEKIKKEMLIKLN